MKLVIEDHCIRCGICVDICSGLFEKDKTNDVILIKFDEVPSDLMKAANEAAASCAVQAIRVIG